MKIRAAIERLLHPGYGFCGRCKRPWACVEGHMTQYDYVKRDEVICHTQSRKHIEPTAIIRRCFPLCEKCWKELGTARARMPYYSALVDRWMDQGIENPHEIWAKISAAVIQEEIDARIN